MAQTPHLTDAELKAAVTEELAWTAGVNDTNIGVAVDHGAVMLSGSVGSYPERRLAENAAVRVRGVTAVAEEITVRSGWNAVNDSDIARQAGEALDRAVDVPDGAVLATVHEHTVTLSGQVSWNHQRKAAERSVRYIKGVVDVYNAITIWTAASATNIHTAISAALVRSAKFTGNHIAVTTDTAGVVTLEGAVPSWAERREAEHIVWSAPGVTGIHNHLRVQM